MFDGLVNLSIASFLIDRFQLFAGGDQFIANLLVYSVSRQRWVCSQCFQNNGTRAAIAIG